LERGYITNPQGYSSNELERVFSGRQREALLRLQATPGGATDSESESEVSAVGATDRPGMSDQKKRGTMTPLFLFGVTFAVALLVLAIIFPEPSPFQYVVFRIILALASAGIASCIPGFLEVEIADWLKAGGALGVFVVVFFFSPAKLVATAPGSDARPGNIEQPETEQPDSLDEDSAALHPRQ
jgi:hypothetical protein